MGKSKRNCRRTEDEVRIHESHRRTYEHEGERWGNCEFNQGVCRADGDYHITC